MTLRENTVGSAFPKSLSPDSRYLLMNWYLETAGNRAEVRSRNAASVVRRQAAAEIFARWRDGILDTHDTWLRPLGGDAVAMREDVLRRLSSTNSLREGRRELVAIQEAVADGIPIKVDRNELFDAALWQADAAAGREDFVRWLGTADLTLPLPPTFPAEALRRAIAERLRAIDAVVAFEGAVLAAEAMANEGHLLAAIDSLSQAADALPAEHVTPFLDVDPLLAPLAARQRTLARQAIDMELLTVKQTLLPRAADATGNLAGGDTTLDHCADLVHDVEEALSGLVTTWGSTPARAEALEAAADQIVAAARACAALRGTLWAHEMAGLARAGMYWDMYAFLTGRLTDVRTWQPEAMAAYAFADRHIGTNDPIPVSCRSAIEEAMFGNYAPALPAALEQLLATGERHVTLSLKHGVRIAVCTMIARMTDVLGSRPCPQTVTELRQRAAEAQAASERYFRDIIARRRILVGPFTAAEPGLGITFRKDLHQAIVEELGATGIGDLVDVIGTDAKPDPRDLLVQEGHVAAFDADETSESETVRTVRRWSAVTTEDNPDYVPAVGPGAGNAAPDGAAPKRYTQTLVEYAIHQRRIERVAHIRVTFRLNGIGADSYADINEFFRKPFVQEELHPFTDVRELRTLTATDDAELRAPQPAPELVRERIWTSSEMLDWARKQTLALAARRVVRTIERLPLEMAAEAAALEQKGAWLDATDTWGFCCQYCRHVDPHPERFRKALDEDHPPGVVDQLRRDLAVQEQLETLKQHVEQDMVEAVLEILKQQEP